MVRCLNFLERPTEGEVLVGGKDLSTLTEKELRKQRQEIAMIFQHFNLLMQKNVIDNICFPLLLRGEKKADAHKRAMELLKLVDLEEKANAYPSQLSGGQKQRVAIARALASDPKILLCDEATSALDPQTTASILALLKDINEKFGITIVIITHQMAVIREICKHVAILNHGVLVEEGEVEEIFNHPKSEAARDDMAEAVEDAFRYGKLVLATTTYNGDIFPFMKTFIEHLTERGYRNRTIGLIENGSWAPTAAKTMLKMFEGSKNLTFTDTTVTIKSAVNTENEAQIAALAEELCK